MFGFTTPTPTRPGLLRRPSLRLEDLETRDTPTTFANDDPNYTVQSGSVLTVDAKGGVLNNDFSTDNPNAVIIARQKSAAVYTPTNPLQPVPALPQNSLTLLSNGSFTFIAPSNYDSTNGPVTFTYQAVDTNTTVSPVSRTATVTINITTNTGQTRLYATGSGPGTPAQVRVYEASSGNERFSFFPYEAGFTSGVRVATGDLNADGFDDVVTSPAEGGSARIVVYDGKTGVRIADFFSFEPSFRGGAEIAIGDVDGAPNAVGSRLNELIIGAGLGGGPRVIVYNIGPANPANPASTNGVPQPLAVTPLSDFFAYESTFRNGVRVAAGNIGGFAANDTNRRDYIVTGAGPGGGPAVRVFDGRSTIGITEPPQLASFFAFDSGTRGGVSVAVGRFRGNGLGADIVAGSGATGTVRVFDGRSTSFLRELVLPPSDGSITGGTSGSGGTTSAGSTNFGGSGGLITTLGGTSGTGGIRVAVTDRNGDGLSDIVTGAGSGTTPRVRIFDGNSFAEIDNFLPYSSNFLGGVFVGGNSL